MPVSFDTIHVGQTYSRQELAKIWNYTSYPAIARGVVTPKNDNKIVLFVTKEKQAGATQYQDRIEHNKLYWEGPKDHFAEDRMLRSNHSSDEIHLFYRERHHSDFVYYGEIRLIEQHLHLNIPSKFVFSLP